MRKRSLFGFDIFIFSASLALVIIGILFIYSSSVSSSGEIVSNEYIKQIIWAVLGIALLFVVFVTDYAFFRNISLYLYIGSIILLIFTFLFGKTVNGAKSWIGFLDFGIQPSEFAKITTIIFLSWYYENAGKDIQSLKTFLGGLFITAIPTVLIFIQPDMGTALVYIPIFLMISLVSGVKKRYVFFILIVIVLVIVFTLFPSWDKYIYHSNMIFTQLLNNSKYILWLIISLILALALSITGYIILKKQYFYWLIYFLSAIILAMICSIIGRKIMQDYQIMRLIVFLDPSIDSLGTGWNINQSITAVGSGGFLGKGFLNGTQSHYKFLPQQSTDFIFSIIAEEWGFIGSVAVLFLFMVIIVRIYLILFAVKDKFSLGICSGICAMIIFHVFINIGMAIGIMPITGIPLFFLSYGGSSLLTALIGIGLVLNVYLRRYKY